MNDEKSKEAIATTYLSALVNSDGPAAATLFTADGVIDDGTGGRKVGRSAIEEFIGQPRILTKIEGPFVIFLEPGRIVVFATMVFPSAASGSTEARLVDAEGQRKFRWIFHIFNSHITHLSTSFVRTIPEGGYVRTGVIQ